MINFEELLTRLQAEGLTLAEAEQSQDPEVLHGLKGKKNQDHIRKFRGISEYLEPYPLDVITSREAAEVLLFELKNRKLLGIDIETSKTADHPQAGLNPRISEIRLLQLFDGDRVYIFDCQQIGGVEWISQLKDTPLVAHNAAFEAQHFHHAWIDFDKLDCSMLMGRVFLNRNYSLAESAREAFELELDKALQVSDWNRERLLPEQIQYAALDAVVTYQLHKKYSHWFIEHPHYRATYQFLQKLIYPLVRQQAHGIRVDTEAHDQLVNGWEIQVRGLKQALAEDGLTNPTSIKQVQAYLQEKLSEAEIEAWPRTATGNLSTNKDALANLENHPVLGQLAEFNTARTRLANFGPKLRELLVEGELYPSYQIAGMVSGRYKCREPNIQNNPRSGFKHIYRAPKGWQFVTGDLSQVELRVAGLISEDPVILQAYATGKDLHRLMAAKMTGKPESEITKEERTAAKGVNFGLLFGGGAKGLQQYVRASYGVDMSLERAQQAKQTFHTTYQAFTLWQRAIVKHTNQHDESETIYSRLTRHYSHRDHYYDGQYRDIYTHGINYPIQGSAWEILALAIRYVDHYGHAGIRISHHVYDELCLVVREDLVMEAAMLLHKSFRFGYRRVFPGCNLSGIVEVGSGSTWVEASSNVIPIHDEELAAQ